MAQGGLDHRQPVAGGARSHSRYGFSARGRATGGPRVLYSADPVPQAGTSGSPNRPKQTGKTQPSLALAWPVRVWVRASTLGTMVPPQAISPGGGSNARWTQEPEPQEPQWEARNTQILLPVAATAPKRPDLTRPGWCLVALNLEAQPKPTEWATTLRCLKC